MCLVEVTTILSFHILFLLLRDISMTPAARVLYLLPDLLEKLVLYKPTPLGNELSIARSNDELWAGIVTVYVQWQ